MVSTFWDAATRWPSRELIADRSQGVQLATIRELARYWAADYDWRACEARLNALPQFTTEIDGAGIHGGHQGTARLQPTRPRRAAGAWPVSGVLLAAQGPDDRHGYLADVG